MKKIIFIGSAIILIFSLFLAENVQASKSDEVGTTFSVITKPSSLETGLINSINFQPPIINLVSNNNPPMATSTNSSWVKAENIIFGTFGANTGGGDFSFPRNLTINGTKFSFGRGTAIKEENSQMSFNYGNSYLFDNQVIVNGKYDDTQLIIKAALGQFSNTNPIFKLQDNAGYDLFHLSTFCSNTIFMGLNSGSNYSACPAYDYGVVALGYYAASELQGGLSDTFVGAQAGKGIVSGSYNTALGSDALLAGDGSYNVALGYRAGAGNIGSGNIMIGYNVTGKSGDSNKLYINNDSNIPLIYGDFAADRVGINTDNPDATLRVNGSIKANNYYAVNGKVGLSKSYSLKAFNGKSCTMTFSNGLLTSSSCPTIEMEPIGSGNIH